MPGSELWWLSLQIYSLLFFFWVRRCAWGYDIEDFISNHSFLSSYFLTDCCGQPNLLIIKTHYNPPKQNHFLNPPKILIYTHPICRPNWGSENMHGHRSIHGCPCCSTKNRPFSTTSNSRSTFLRPDSSSLSQIKPSHKESWKSGICIHHPFAYIVECGSLFATPGGRMMPPSGRVKRSLGGSLS